MAIPMSWPLHEEPELDLLLEHLLITIRQTAHLRRLRRLRRMQFEHRTRAEQPPANSGPIHQPEASYLRQRETSGLRVSQHPQRIFYYDQETVPAPESPTASLPENPQPENNPPPDLLNDITNGRTRKPNQNETETETSTSWIQAGADLRHTADAFEEMRTPPQESTKNYRKPKDWNLLSTLCPMVVNTVWPILALVLGWNVLTRKR